MVRSDTPEPADGNQTLGDLVNAAAKDVSQLIRYEIDLAKTELRGDLKRVGLAGALAGVAVFVVCLVLVLCCFAFAYGLVLIVAGACVLLAGLAVGIAALKLRHLSGLRRTRKSVTEGLGMLRRDSHPEVSSDGHPQVSSDGRPEVSSDGQRPEIAGRKPR
jgi:uncharacterized membrane protein YqjE